MKDVLTVSYFAFLLCIFLCYVTVHRKCTDVLRIYLSPQHCTATQRRLEGWPNTAARLAGWRRVTQQGVILYVMDGPHAACPDGPHHHLPRSGADVLLNVQKTPPWATSRKEGMAWYSSRPMSSLWVWPTRLPGREIKPRTGGINNWATPPHPYI
jgi:hypothetical protein